MEPILLHDPKTKKEWYFAISESNIYEAKGDGWPDEVTYMLTNYRNLTSCLENGCIKVGPCIGETAEPPVRLISATPMGPNLPGEGATEKMISEYIKRAQVL